MALSRSRQTDERGGGGGGGQSHETNYVDTAYRPLFKQELSLPVPAAAGEREREKEGGNPNHQSNK